MRSFSKLNRYFNYFKKNRNLIIRLSLFAFLIYVAVPFLIGLIKGGRRFYIQYNFYSFIPFTLCLIIIFAVFNRKHLRKYKDNVHLKQTLIFIIFSIAAFTGYFLVRFRIQYTLTNYTTFIMIAGLLYLTASVFLALAIFGISLFKNTWKSILILAIVTYIFVVFTTLLHRSGTLLSYGISKISYYILWLISPSTSLELVSGAPVLGLHDFVVKIGLPCSGVDGISIFTGLFILVSVYSLPRISWKMVLVVYLIGIIGVYILNIIRVVIIILLGQVYPEFAIGIFHSQAGWLLFTVFVLILIYYTYPHMLKNTKHSETK